jgi:hypothetical protein
MNAVDAGWSEFQGFYIENPEHCPSISYSMRLLA